MTATLESTIQDVTDVFNSWGWDVPEHFKRGKAIGHGGKEIDLKIGVMNGLKETLIEVAKDKLSECEIKTYNDTERVKLTMHETEHNLADSGKFTLATFNHENKDIFYKKAKLKKSICFYGSTGSGKTHLASALCRAFIINDMETQKIVDFDFGLEVESNRFSTEIKNTIRKLKHASILFLDDFGKTPIMKNETYNFYGRILFDIFDYRNRAMKKKNIITAGFKDKSEIFKFCGAELYRRMFCDGDVEFFELKKF